MHGPGPRGGALDATPKRKEPAVAGSFTLLWKKALPKRSENYLYFLRDAFLLALRLVFLLALR